LFSLLGCRKNRGRIETRASRADEAKEPKSADCHYALMVA
jgi:hypothetical protein